MIPRPSYSIDEILRVARFKIYSRPKDGEPIWRRTGDTPMKQSDAAMQVAIELGNGRLGKK